MHGRACAASRRSWRCGVHVQRQQADRAWRDKAGRTWRNQRRRRPRGKVLRRADGWPIHRHSIVERAWTGHSVVILGGGPSLTAGDGLRRLEAGRDRAGRPLAIIAVNNAYQVAPFADVLYAADGRWWQWHAEDPALKAFKGLKLTVSGSEGEGGPGADGHVLRCETRSTYSRDPDRLGHGGNGGYQAINFAALAGAERIILLGFDMKHQAGRTNWHEPHPIKTPERWVKQWIPRFRELAAELKKDGIEVRNASEETALDAFPRCPIADLLPDPAVSV